MSLYSKRWFRGISWLFVFVCMGLIFWVSSRGTLPLSLPYDNKIVHVAVYWVLGFLAANAFSEGTNKKRFWLALVLTSLYGASDELHQYFVPGHEAAVWTWLADIFGAWMGAYLYLKSEPVWRKGPADRLPR
jgi:hypothetical protein